MAQQKRQNTAVGKTATPNIISDVVLEPSAEETWLAALADISRMVRVQKGGAAYFIKMGEETAHAQPSGVLTLKTMVDGEKVEMDIPPAMWSLRG